MPARLMLRLAVAGLALSGTAAWSQPIGCMPPLAPFLPSDSEDVRDYTDLLREDFETYIADFDDYLRCLDAERARVMTEAQAVTQDYGRFQEIARTPSATATVPGSM